MQTLMGLLIGLAIGTTGVGGGVLTAPLLIVLGGYPAAVSIGTALLFSTVVKIGAVAVYMGRRQTDSNALKYLLIGGIPGAIAGPLLLRGVNQERWNGPVLFIVGLTITTSALFSLWRMRHAEARGSEHRRLLPWFAFGIGVEVGFSSAGAGALGNVILLRLTQLAPAAVVGTDLVFGLVLSALSGGIHMASGNWNAALLGGLLAGGIPGAVAGSLLAGKLPARVLRAVVLSWAALLGGLLVKNGLLKWLATL